MADRVEQGVPHYEPCDSLRCACYQDGFADGVECVCDETSMRNCPVHQNDGADGDG